MQNQYDDFWESRHTGVTSDGKPFRNHYRDFMPGGVEYERTKEKKQIKRTANAAGLSFILVLLCTFLIGVISGIFMLVFSEPAVSDFMQDPAIQQIVQICYSLLLFTLPFILIFKAFGYRIGDFISFQKSETRTEWTLFFFGMSVCAFANISSAYIDNFFSSFGIDYSMEEYEMPVGFFGFLLCAIATAIVPALVEEFALRGIVMGALRKFGDGFAIIVSAICFGLIHGNFEQIPFAFMVGIFLGYSVAKTNSLRVAMAVHCVNNLVSVVFSYLQMQFSEDTVNLIYLIYLMVSLAIGLAFLRFTTNNNALFELKQGNTLCSLKQKIKTFFTAPAVVIFVVLCCLEAVSFFFV